VATSTQAGTPVQYIFGGALDDQRVQPRAVRAEAAYDRAGGAEQRVEGQGGDTVVFRLVRKRVAVRLGGVQDRFVEGVEGGELG
jgi:hypothetical protein